MAAGAGSIPEPRGCSAPQLQETPSPQCRGGAVPLLPFGSQACLAQLPQHTGTFEALQPSSSWGARPAGKGCHCPISWAACWAQPQAAREGGCSHRITLVPLLPGIANPPGHASCCGQHQSALAGSLHRQHRKRWGRDGSTLLLEKKLSDQDA